MSSQKKEKLLIENLLASTDVFSRCIGIVKSEYFENPEYRPAVKFITEYFNKYNSVPSLDIVNADFDIGLESKTLTLDQYSYTCDEVEKFCKQAGFFIAIKHSLDDLEKNEFDKAYKRVADAMLISLQKDLGVELYDDPEEYLKKLLITEINHSTGIKSLDDHLNGGLARKTFTLFSANSGVGKSNMLANLGINYSLQGLNVLYLSLELPEDMIYIRLSSILTRVNINLWKQKIPEIASKIITKKNDGAGSYKVKRLPVGSNANAIRSYLKHYELEYKRRPDIIIVDYLDLMHPNGGIKNKGVFDQDKEKSEELTEILVEYDAIGISASQQNREALRLASPDQGVIAGGISKVNTVHNYISLAMAEEAAIRGEMLVYFLKTRTSSGKGQTVMLLFDNNTLAITDPIDANNNALVTIVQKMKNRDKNNKGLSPDSPLGKKLGSIIGNIKGMPSDKPQPPEVSAKERYVSNLTVDEDIPKASPYYQEDSLEKDDGDELMNLMSSF